MSISIIAGLTFLTTKSLQSTSTLISRSSSFTPVQTSSPSQPTSSPASTTVSFPGLQASSGLPTTTSYPATSTSASIDGDGTSTTAQTSTSDVTTSSSVFSTTPTTTSLPSSPSAAWTGTIAGTAVGCAIAGILVGLAAAFILLRRRRIGSAEKLDGVPTNHDPKPIIGAIPFGYETSSEVLFRQPLLDATPDGDIVREVQCLGVLVRQHVESHYHDRPTSADLATLTRLLVDLGFGAGDRGLSRGARAVAALCHEPATRQMGLRRVLLHVLFASIDHRSAGSLSLLPAPVVEFLRAIPRDEDHGMSNAQGMYTTKQAQLQHH